jgi:Arc/MetJ family transcription regulator
MGKLHYQKTTVEIDVEELAKAQESLRTRSTKETVNAALRDVNRRAALKQAAEYVRSGKLRAPDETTWAAFREPRS